MQPNEPGLRVAIGVSGSGKTVGVTTDAHAAARSMPVLVLDSMREFVSVPDDLRPYTAGTHDIKKAIEHLNAGKRFVVLLPTKENIVSYAAKGAEWAERYPGLAGLVIPEAHHIAPVTGPVSLEIDRIATQWRHHNVAFWCDTQRIARLHHSITDNAREMKLYAQWGDADLKRVKEIGGNALVDAVNECARKCAPVDEGGLGEPGWHVRLGMWRQPPFDIVRGKML